MEKIAIQDLYPEDLSYCYGCGRLNEHGHRIKSYWEGDKTVARFTPESYHIAIPGYVYGGLIASLIDCHGTGTAALAVQRYGEDKNASREAARFVTASLKVDFIKPTPLGPELQLQGEILEMKGRKVISEIKVIAEGKVTAIGKVVAVQIQKGLTDTNN
ncbi:MAG: PaaI family thioesterase [Melioribacteraceae bacterium]|nr:PaaI family thioesterase [Melioribacteraceae bacterium]